MENSIACALSRAKDHSISNRYNFESCPSEWRKRKCVAAPCAAFPGDLHNLFIDSREWERGDIKCPNYNLEALYDRQSDWFQKDITVHNYVEAEQHS